MEEGMGTFYPGERSAAAKQYNMENGMTVDETIWQRILQLLK